MQLPRGMHAAIVARPTVLVACSPSSTHTATTSADLSMFDLLCLQADIISGRRIVKVKRRTPSTGSHVPKVIPPSLVHGMAAAHRLATACAAAQLRPIGPGRSPT